MAGMTRDASFVVRIWWEKRHDAPPLWRGQAVHTASSQARYFDSLEDLLAFVRTWTGISPSPGTEALSLEARPGSRGDTPGC